MTGPLYGLIVAGGAGTRLWPCSRGDRPKQALPLLADGRSVIQLAYRRLRTCLPAERLWVVGGNEHAGALASQVDAAERDLFAEQGVPAGRVPATEGTPDGATSGVQWLLEPQGRDSGAAVLWGAWRIASALAAGERQRAVVLVQWADQVVDDDALLVRALRRAAEHAASGALVAIGIQPRRASTALGYLRRGREPLSAGVDGGSIHAVEEFFEKPSLAEAEKLLAAGDSLWNAGFFAFHLDSLLRAFATQAPEVWDAFQTAATEHDDPTLCRAETVKALYARLSSQSFDRMLLERLDDLQVLPVDLRWRDLGSWDALHAEWPADEQGNVTRGDVVLEATEGSLVWSEHRLVAALGLRGMAVVDTPDALLVCPLEEGQRVKQLVARLGERQETQHAAFCERPWGWFRVLAEGEGFKVKLIQINPGQALSLQRHRRRAEHWMPLCGLLQVTIDGHTRRLGKNEAAFVPLGAKHRMENPSDAAPVQLIEVQLGSYLGEDDIERFSDRYGRTS